MRRILWPAQALIGRLRYGQKILLVALVLLLQLGFVVYAYVNIQRGQVDFSAKERDGVAYLRPLADLTGRAVAARRLAVSGGDPGATAVTAASAAVPPARKVSIAARVASGCEVAAMPSMAMTGERPGR